MAKMKQVHQIIMDLEQQIEQLTDIKCMLETLFNEPEESPSEEISTVNLKLEDVRAVLAAKSSLGFTQDIKKILSSFGVSKLSEVKESDYASLLKKVEGLGNE